MNVPPRAAQIRSQAETIRILLGCDVKRESRWLRETGVGRRTFERWRRESYGRGWILDRFIPNVGRIGIQSAAVALKRPFTNELPDWVDGWKTRGDSVVVWRWPETLLGVFFSRLAPDHLRDSLNPGRDPAQSIVLSTVPTRSTCPVYFDFEAVWARVTLSQGPLAYPHPLLADEPGRVSSRQTDVGSPALEALLGRRSEDQPSDRPIRVSPFFFPRSEQRAIGTGLVERRTFLDPARLPAAWPGGFRHIALVHGVFRQPNLGPLLLRVLAGLGITPFLFTCNQSDALFATLTTPSRPKDTGDRRPSVMKTLEQILDQIQLIRLPLSELGVIKNHDYRGLAAQGPHSSD